MLCSVTASSAATGSAAGKARCISRPFVGIAVELADDAGDAGPRLRQVVAAVPVAAEAPFLPQAVERAGDLAAVVAADRLDDVGVEHRRRGERLLNRLEPRRALEQLGGAAGHGNLS